MPYFCYVCQEDVKLVRRAGKRICPECEFSERDLTIIRFLDEVRERCGYCDARWLHGTKDRFAALRDHDDVCEMVVGRIGDFERIEDRWVYADEFDAEQAMTAWDGVGEPRGWLLHAGPPAL